MQDKIDLKNASEWWYLANMILKNKAITTENEKDWKNINKYFSELQTYFEVLQYDLKIDNDNWFAYVEEMESSEVESLSKKQKISFWVTLLLVILREYIYKKEAEDLFTDAYRISHEYIKENLAIYLREKFENDDKKITNEIKTIINKTEELWILSELKDKEYKINKMIKAKMSTDDMEKVLDLIKGQFKIG